MDSFGHHEFTGRKVHYLRSRFKLFNTELSCFMFKATKSRGEKNPHTSVFRKLHFTFLLKLRLLK